MRRIRTIVLLETLLIAFAISSAQAVPVQGPDGNFYEFVSTLGPEANQVFWTGGPGGSAAGGVYTDWGLDQPDNGGIQNFLGRAPEGWDDDAGVQGYYVEYAAPEPGTFLLFGTALAGAGLAGWHQRRRAGAIGGTGR